MYLLKWKERRPICSVQQFFPQKQERKLRRRAKNFMKHSKENILSYRLFSALSRFLPSSHFGLSDCLSLSFFFSKFQNLLLLEIVFLPESFLHTFFHLFLAFSHHGTPLKHLNYRHAHPLGNAHACICRSQGVGIVH